MGKIGLFLSNDVQQRQQIAEMRKSIVETNVKNILKKERE